MSQPPSWATDANARLAPVAGREATGFISGEEPPARVVNALIGEALDAAREWDNHMKMTTEQKVVLPNKDDGDNIYDVTFIQDTDFPTTTPMILASIQDGAALSTDSRLIRSPQANVWAFRTNLISPQDHYKMAGSYYPSTLRKLVTTWFPGATKQLQYSTTPGRGTSFTVCTISGGAIGASNEYHCIEWLNTGGDGLFVFCCWDSGGTSVQIYTSTDGITFTRRYNDTHANAGVNLGSTYTRNAINCDTAGGRIFVFNLYSDDSGVTWNAVDHATTLTAGDNLCFDPADQEYKYIAGGIIYGWAGSGSWRSLGDISTGGVGACGALFALRDGMYAFLNDGGSTYLYYIPSEDIELDDGRAIAAYEAVMLMEAIGSNGFVDAACSDGRNLYFVATDHASTRTAWMLPYVR